MLSPMVRLKQHQFVTTRNGHTVEKYEEYELIFKPKDKYNMMFTRLNQWLKEKDPEAYWDWNAETKHQMGIKPDEYDCWCETLTDFLLYNGYEPRFSDDWDRAEIWVKGDHADNPAQT